MDYPQPVSWYARCQRGYVDFPLNLGCEPHGTHGYPRQGSYRRRYPDTEPHMLGVFEHKSGLRWNNAPNLLPNGPLIPGYEFLHQARWVNGVQHGLLGVGNPTACWSGTRGHPHQRPQWRPRLQYHPRPRSAKYGSADSYSMEQEARNHWTKVHMQSANVRHGDIDSGNVHKSEERLFAMPSQAHEKYVAFDTQPIHQQNSFLHDNSLPAGHRPRLFWQKSYKKQAYDEASPLYAERRRQPQDGFPSSRRDTRTDTVEEGLPLEQRGKSSKHQTKKNATHPDHGPRAPDPNLKKRSREPSSPQRTPHKTSPRNRKGPTVCTGNAQPRVPPTQRWESRFERWNKTSHPKVPLGASEAAAASSPTCKPASVPQDQPSSFEQSPEEEEEEDPPTPRSDSSDNVDFGHRFRPSRHKGNSEEQAYHDMPKRTRSTSKQVQQEIHRCALAAKALHIERVRLKKEWGKLRREQDALRLGQRRLHYDWQAFQQQRQQSFVHDNDDDTEFLDSGDESDVSSAEDRAESPPRKHNRRWTEGYENSFTPPTTFEKTSSNSQTLLEEYNQRWEALLNGITPDIPWPTTNFRASTLSKLQYPSSESLSPQELMKWNAFNFFTSAFRVKPSLRRSDYSMIYGIRNPPLEVTQAILKQVRQDVKRWHPDKLGCRGAELAGDERAKAVFAAVHELYRICTARTKG